MCGRGLGARTTSRWGQNRKFLNRWTTEHAHLIHRFCFLAGLFDTCKLLDTFDLEIVRSSLILNVKIPFKFFFTRH